MTTGGVSGAARVPGSRYTSGVYGVTRRSRTRRSTAFSCRSSTAAVYTSRSSSRASTDRRSTCRDRTSPSGTRSSRAAFPRSRASSWPGASFSPSIFTIGRTLLTSQKVQNFCRFLKLQLRFPRIL